MRCHHCGEVSANNRTECWNCKKPLEPTEELKKVCPNCNSIYNAKVETCETCGIRLITYNNKIKLRKQSNGNKKLVLFVVLGVIGLLMFFSELSKAGSDNYTAQDLMDAQKKYLNGEKITREDETMLKGYYKYEANKNKYADEDDE